MLRKENLGVINPLNPNKREKIILSAFLAEAGKPNLVMKGKIHKMLMINPADNKLVMYSFQLTHSILSRKRKDNKPGERHEVIANHIKLGSGGFGTILKSAGVITPFSTQQFFKAKTRAIKQQAIDASIMEYAHSKMLDHLRMKPPVKAAVSNQEKNSYLVMRHLPGKDLYRLIEKEKCGQIKIDTDQRIQLSIAILRAIQTEAHDYGLIHRDIKPENIMVDLSKLTANLIDYLFSKDMNNPEDNPPCNSTIVTQPVEQFFGCDPALPKFTMQTDSYAAGKTLAELWHAAAEVNLLEPEYSMEREYVKFYNYAELDTNFVYTDFMNGDLTSAHSFKIQHMFEQLTRAHPDKRWSLEKAIQTLLQIQQERCTASAAQKMANTPAPGCSRNHG